MKSFWYHMLPKGENCPGHPRSYTSIYCAGVAEVADAADLKSANHVGSNPAARTNQELNAAYAEKLRTGDAEVDAFFARKISRSAQRARKSKSFAVTADFAKSIVSQMKASETLIPTSLLFQVRKTANYG